MAARLTTTTYSLMMATMMTMIMPRSSLRTAKMTFTLAMAVTMAWAMMAQSAWRTMHHTRSVAPAMTEMTTHRTRRTGLNRRDLLGSPPLRWAGSRPLG